MQWISGGLWKTDLTTKKNPPVLNCLSRQSHYRHSRSICFPAFLIGCAWDGLCVGWRGQTGRVSRGQSGRQRGWEQVRAGEQQIDSDLFCRSVSAFAGYETRLLREGQTWRIWPNRERPLFRDAHVLVNAHHPHLIILHCMWRTTVYLFCIYCNSFVFYWRQKSVKWWKKYFST